MRDSDGAKYYKSLFMGTVNVNKGLLELFSTSSTWFEILVDSQSTPEIFLLLYLSIPLQCLRFLMFHICLWTFSFIPHSTNQPAMYVSSWSLFPPVVPRKGAQE